MATGAASLVELARRGRELMSKVPLIVTNKEKISSNREQFEVCVLGMENMRKAVGAKLPEGWISKHIARFLRNYDWVVKDLKSGQLSEPSKEWLEDYQQRDDATDPLRDWGHLQPRLAQLIEDAAGEGLQREAAETGKGV